MERDIIHIDEDLCDGCGDCIPNCHEGALQMIDGKATLISDLMCDGLGACIGHCPQGAITIEKREAEPYNETEVIKGMAIKGKNVVVAHLTHLLDHKENDLVNEGLSWLENNKESLSFDLNEVIQLINKPEEAIKEQTFNISQMAPKPVAPQPEFEPCDCPGSQSREISGEEVTVQREPVNQAGELRQWPVQFHLINPAAGYFKEADLLLAADCSAYTMGNFHSDYLKGKSLIIACPKLDSAQESYHQKLVQLIDQSMINTIHLLIMEVPCCGGLLRLVDQALESANRKVPVKCSVISAEGKVLSENWL